MTVAHARQEKHYNQRRTGKTYNVGDVVLVYRPLRKKGRATKLLFRYHGPFKIVRQINALNYVVEPMYGSKKKKECVHVSKLKRFVERATIPSKPSAQCGEPAPRIVKGTPAGTGTTRRVGRREQGGSTAGSQPGLSARTRVRSQVPCKNSSEPLNEIGDECSTTVGGHRLRSRSRLHKPVN